MDTSNRLHITSRYIRRNYMQLIIVSLKRHIGSWDLGQLSNYSNHAVINYMYVTLPTMWM